MLARVLAHVPVPRPAVSRKPTILLVDDDPKLREVVGYALQREGHSVQSVRDGAEGGTITFRTSNKTYEADGATTVMEAGEEVGVGMPYGCRMGICHTCTLNLVEGTVRDLRSGQEISGPNERVQTCITAAAGDCTIDI